MSTTRASTDGRLKRSSKVGAPCAVRALAGVGALVASGILGCATKRTIPPTDGKVMLDTSLEPLPTLCVIALNKGHTLGSYADQPLIYDLPPGIKRETWSTIGRQLPATAKPMQPDDTRVVAVEEVRIDGGQAQVDVVVPTGTLYQLYTLHLTGGVFSGWKITYVQPWMLRTNPPVCNNPWATGQASASDTPAPASGASSTP